MSVVHGYTETVLKRQLRSLGLNKRQREIVLADVSMRLESLLSHWHDVAFRRTVLAVGTEEASFWDPRDASIEVRSLVVVAVRNSIVEDLNASRPYTEGVPSVKEPPSEEFMPWITGEAIKYFQAINLDAEHVQPTKDIFGALPKRFPNAWQVLSILGDSSDMEITWELQKAEAEALDLPDSRMIQGRIVSVTRSGLDPEIDSGLATVLRLIERGEQDVFPSSCFKSITRNPEKLFAIIDHVLRYGGFVLTPNYLLSPVYVARRVPLIRPAHSRSEDSAQFKNPTGLSKVHREALAAIRW